MSLLDTAREKLFGALGMGQKPELTQPQDQPPADLDLASWVKKTLEKARGNANRVAHEAIWMSNCATLLGYDNLYFDTYTRQFKNSMPGTSYTKRNRLVSNQILSACQNRLARMCKVPPRWEIRPDGNKPEDRDKARLQYDVLVDLWERLGLNRKRIEMTQWKQQAGHAYFHVCYNDDQGEPLYDPEQEVVVGQEGDIRVDSVSAFEVFPDPLAKNWDELQYCFRAKIRPIEYFRKRYDKGKLVKPEGAWLLSLQYEQRINSLSNFGPGFAGVTQDAFDNTAIEIVYYEKPTEQYPNGRMVIVANGVILENKELPVGEIPLVKFDDILVAGKFYPESPIAHARPLQQQYNRDLSKAADWLNKFLAGKYIAEKRHGIIKEGFNDRAEIIEYTAIPNTPEPHAVAVPSLPEYYFKHSAQLKSEIYEQFGLSEVSRGQLPAAGIPAIGMQLLVEQDETRIGIEIESDEHGYARLGRLMLLYAAKFFKTPRKLKKKSSAGEYQVSEYVGDDLGDKPDVSVVRGSTIPTSRSLRRQEIMNAWQQGVWGNVQDPKVQQKVQEKLEFGDITEMWKSQSLDKAQIQKTIDQIEQGIIPDINPLDNHALHIQEKNDFRKTDRCDSWPPVLRGVLEDDIYAHLAELHRLQNPALYEAQNAVKQELDTMPPDDQGMRPLAQDQLMAENGTGAPAEAPPTGEVNAG